MKPTVLGLVGVIMLVPACGGLFGTGARSSTPEAGKKPVPKVEAAAKSPRAKAGKKASKDEPASAPLAVGDYFVERFSGSFRSTPLTLTEEVVAAEGKLFVVDFTLKETGSERSQRLRTRYNPETRRVEKVSVMAGDREIPAPLAAYDRLMEKTSFAADSNDGLIAKQKQTCLVGDHEIDCETKDYKVSVGEREATLSVTRSDAVQGRDVAGQIVADDGTVLYRAELVDMRHGSPAGSVAAR